VSIRAIRVFTPGFDCLTKTKARPRRKSTTCWRNRARGIPDAGGVWQQTVAQAEMDYQVILPTSVQKTLDRLPNAIISDFPFLIFEFH
jgi:hypothetical protein